VTTTDKKRRENEGDKKHREKSKWDSNKRTEKHKPEHQGTEKRGSNWSRRRKKTASKRQ
jgi:hypothetical protein